MSVSPLTFSSRQDFFKAGRPRWRKAFTPPPPLPPPPSRRPGTSRPRGLKSKRLILMFKARKGARLFLPCRKQEGNYSRLICRLSEVDSEMIINEATTRAGGAYQVFTRRDEQKQRRVDRGRRRPQISAASHVFSKCCDAARNTCRANDPALAFKDLLFCCATTRRSGAAAANSKPSSEEEEGL